MLSNHAFNLVHVPVRRIPMGMVVVWSQRRSILTGEPDKVAVQMSAPRTLNIGDIMFAVAKLGRAAGVDPGIGKIVICKDSKSAVFDMGYKAAEELIKFALQQNLEAISFSVCSILPALQTPPETNVSSL